MTEVKTLKDEGIRNEVREMAAAGMSSREICHVLGWEGKKKSTVGDLLRGDTYKQDDAQPTPTKEYTGPKILTFDIETAPILGAVWGLWQQNVGLNMIQNEWYVLSWAAKWLHKNEVMYEDKRESWNTSEDVYLLQGIWKLLDEADIVITQNGKKFDSKKLNARFIMHGMKPPSRYRHIDTLQEAKKHFAFTSNKLEWMTDKLCVKYKKLKHGNFAGYTLWEQCLKGNPAAWEEMEEYNRYDVLSLEELYGKMRPWMKGHLNLNIYDEGLEDKCTCGSTNWEHNGYAYTNLSKFDKFQCQDCGFEVRGRANLLSKEKRETLKMNIQY